MLRFAPSPTGDMHIGNLRAAIFNYIVAKQRGEKFLIRIEDTDSARNIKGADKEILAILNLFGLFWDKLVYQSENFPLHRKLAQNLVEKNKAFYCYATKDFLEQKRAEASAQKRAFRYKDEWAEVCKNENKKPAIRLRGDLGAEYALDSADSQNLGEKNPCEAPENSPASWCKKSESKGAVVPPADFLLEAEKRGSPPKSEKAELFGNTIKKSWGERGGGCSPFCEKESELSGENGGKVAESTLDSADSLAMAKNKDFAQSISFFDAIKGECKFSANEIDSFVILREDTIPTYNFACAVDDMLYDISFIIRGEDHMSNTPKQMLIHRALGYDRHIEYAHLPIILNDEGKKMSKRESESSVKWLLSQGFLPRAIVNYLLLMGNNPPCEIFSLDEAIAWFDLSQLSKSPVRFDINQLRHINREHLKRLSESEMGLLLVESNEKLRQVVGNSPLGLQFRTQNAESALDSAESQNLVKNNSCEAPENSPASWCKKSESKGAEVPPADFLLEAEKRGSPPKSEKRQLLARRESGERGAALLREETSEIDKNCGKIAESSLDSAISQSGLPRRFCESARNDEMIDCNADSANQLAMTENKAFAESTLDSVNQAKIAESKFTKSLGAIGKIFLEEASTLNELNDKLNHIFAPKDLKNFEFGENARILKSEILRLLAESSTESFAESSTESCPLNDFESLKSALSKNAPFKGKAFFMPLRFLLTGAQKGPHLDTLYPHLRPFLAQILKD